MSFPNITNIYELLDQDGEEGVARLPAKKEVVAPKTVTPAVKSTTPAVKSAQQSSYNKSQSPKGDRRQGDGQRRDNRDNRDNRGPRQDNRPPRQGGDQQGETERQPVEGARRDRPADRQQAREKGESRGDDYRRNAPAGGFVGNKRVYDRKSGTGRGDGQGREDKRGGRGKGGWGAADGSDVVNETIKEIAKEGENIVQGEGVADNKGTDAAAEKLEDQVPKEETEEEKKKREDREKEEKQVSWSDYQKQLAEKKSQSTLLQASANAQRKANEGVDEKTAKKWSSYEQVKRDDTPKEEEKKADGAKTAKKQTVRLDELFTIKETPKPQYTERDDRKGGKGGKPYDNKKGGQQNRKQGGQQASSGPEVTFDANSFPTLQ